MKKDWLYKDNVRKLSSEEKEEMFGSIRKKIENRRRQRRVRLYLSVSAVACIALLVVFIKPFFPEKTASWEDSLLCATDSPVNEKDIQLILTNNRIITFDKDADIRYDDEKVIIVETGDRQLKTAKVAKEVLALNTLIVPKGKRSSLTLADGSKLWVNSGSTLKFPSQFNTSKREIWVDGEIYIDVAQDKNHPFYVNTSKLVIDVVGTQFNVSAYSEEPEHTVVLVKGRVNVNTDAGETRLLPNQLLSVSLSNSTVREIDVNNYISWKDGYLQFDSEPLSAVLKRISRHYDVTIVCDENSSALKCNGKLILFDKVEDVFQTIGNTLPVTCLLEENQATVKRRDK